MTTDWRETTPCPNCGVPVSTEQPIKSWIRSHRELDSQQHCLCIGDSDLWVQRYATRTWHSGVDRSVMYLMLVEIKTHARDLNPPQRELLMLVNELLRTKPWKEHRDHGRFTGRHSQNVRLVHAYLSGRKIPIYCYGVHKLQISGATPPTSERITWDNKDVEAAQLARILRYDLDPDTLRPIEHRSHKRRTDMPALFNLEDVARDTRSEEGA